MSNYDVEAIRNKLKQSQNKKRHDPDQFKPEKAGDDVLKYRFFVLPPIQKDDKVKNGIAKRGMEQFFIQHAEHWVNDAPHACPRVHSEGTERCQICDFGFELLKNEKVDEKRTIILKQWMPSTYSMVNIYFPPVDSNPIALRGKVMFYDAPKTCMDLWQNAINKDNSGPEDDPSAFGIIFDENAAFCFQLEVKKHGKNNEYKQSKFIHNHGKALPIAKGAAAIQAILDQRIDLYTKIMDVDKAKLKVVFNSMVNGDDPPNNGGNNGGFDADETSTKAGDNKATSEVKAETKVETKPKTETKAETAPEVKEEAKVEKPATAAASSNEIEELLSQLE